MTEAPEREQHLAALLRRAATASPQRTALIHRGRETDWQTLDAGADAAAHALRGLGLVEGDRVALHLGNTPDFVVAALGALRAGLVAVPVNTGYTRDEMAHLLTDSGAAVLVTTRTGAPVAQVLEVELESLRHVLVCGEGDLPHAVQSMSALMAAAPTGPAEQTGGGEGLAVLLYTSGTSGRPKGAMLSHRALLANLEQSAQIVPAVTDADSVVLLVLPLSHIYGLAGGLGSVLHHGATGVLVDRFEPHQTLAEIRRHDVTVILGAPPMYVAWSMMPDLGDSFAAVQVALSGAAPLPGEVLARILDLTGRHVFEGYGLTETAPVLTSTLMSEVAKPDSIGRPLPGIELELREESGGPVAEGDPGEIVVRGENLFSGYWPDGTDGPDDDGWWATGDVAYLDPDGDLHLVDRRRELILVSGFNVYPREVETVLTEHPDVAEAAVLGIPHPYAGESVKAIVVPREGAHPDADELIAFVGRSLARFKCPTVVEVVESLPHSATGKVSKGRLRDAGLAEA